MLGAIIGDVVGSRFEFDNYKGKDFELYTDKCRFTDDTVMTCAVAKALVDCNGDWDNLSETAVKYMVELGTKHFAAGYGARFFNWLRKEPHEPYGSYGNGSAMRISPVAWAAQTPDELKELSRKVTEVTHNHPEGIKGAEATAVAIFMARSGNSKDQIRDYIQENYYDLNFTIDEIRPAYRFDETCQGSVPQAIECFLEADSFEDTIRTAVSLGGDSDTIGAIAGAIAEAFYGVPKEIGMPALQRLDPGLLSIVAEFAKIYRK